MINNLTTLPTAGGGGAFASVTPAGLLFMEQSPVSSTTTSTGSNTLTALPNDFPCSGDLIFVNITQPQTPALGECRLYFDSTLKVLCFINDVGTVFQLNGPPWPISTLPADSVTSAFEFVLDGGGAPLALNQLSPYLIVPTNCTITGVTLLADQSGSVTIDVWNCSYANFNPPTHPAVGDSITASAVPALASAVKFTNLTLTGWTTSLLAGSVLACNVKVTATNITRVTCVLTVTKT